MRGGGGARGGGARSGGARGGAAHAHAHGLLGGPSGGPSGADDSQSCCSSKPVPKDAEWDFGDDIPDADKDGKGKKDTIELAPPTRRIVAIGVCAFACALVLLIMMSMCAKPPTAPVSDNKVSPIDIINEGAKDAFKVDDSGDGNSGLEPGAQPSDGYAR